MRETRQGALDPKTSAQTLQTLQTTCGSVGCASYLTASCAPAPAVVAALCAHGGSPRLGACAASITAGAQVAEEALRALALLEWGEGGGLVTRNQLVLVRAEQAEAPARLARKPRQQR